LSPVIVFPNVVSVTKNTFIYFKMLVTILFGHTLCCSHGRFLSIVHNLRFPGVLTKVRVLVEHPPSISSYDKVSPCPFKRTLCPNCQY
jgi:hypothetical protein